MNTTTHLKELMQDNKEKGKKSDGFLIAIKELVFQNEEKEKRAVELIFANKELAFQNEEKEKRAMELIIANKELLFQNEEKEIRAAELIKAEEQLKSVNEELEAFAYSISHDLRAPLRAIHGYSQILKEDYGKQLGSESDRLMDKIMSNAKNMGQLIDDLLAYSRIGRKELQKNDINMQDMVTEICLDLKNAQIQRDIEIHIGCLSAAKADIVAVRQVWVNLISNSIKYSKLKKKAIIEIGSEIKEDEVIYYKKDNGAGFDMRYADKLFGVFQRLHADDEFEGTGVGLAIVHRIITKHGGRVWAEGKPNEGATFYFTLDKS